MAPPTKIPKTPIPTRVTVGAPAGATLPPYRGLPPIRTYVPLPPITPARPSVNLGHALNSSTIQPATHLFPHVGLTNPIPFGTLKPTSNPTPNPANYGSRVSSAIHALTKPTHSSPMGPKPTVNFGHMVAAAIRSVTRS